MPDSILDRASQQHDGIDRPVQDFPRQPVHVADKLGIGGELTDAIEWRGLQPRVEPRDHAIDQRRRDGIAADGSQECFDLGPRRASGESRRPRHLDRLDGRGSAPGRLAARGSVGRLRSRSGGDQIRQRELRRTVDPERFPEDTTGFGQAVRLGDSHRQIFPAIRPVNRYRPLSSVKVENRNSGRLGDRAVAGHLQFDRSGCDRLAVVVDDLPRDARGLVQFDGDIVLVGLELRQPSTRAIGAARVERRPARVDHAPCRSGQRKATLRFGECPRAPGSFPIQAAITIAPGTVAEATPPSGGRR